MNDERRVEPEATSSAGLIARIGNVLAVIAVVAVVVVHLAAIACRCGGPRIGRSNEPFMVHDHPYVHYNAVVGARSLRTTGTTAAYDPAFMAGYANCFVSSSNPVAPLFVWALGDANAGYAYDLHCFITLAAIPALVALGAVGLGVRPIGVAVATLAWLPLFWGGESLSYVDFGMVAFLASTGWCVALGGALNAFLHRPTILRTSLLAGVAGLTALSHTTAGVVMAPACLVVLIAHGARFTRRTATRLLFAVVISIVINAYWLAPAIRLYGVAGELPGFFVNPNVGERLNELVTGKHSVSPILLGGLIGLLLVAVDQITRFRKPSSTNFDSSIDARSKTTEVAHFEKPRESPVDARATILFVTTGWLFFLAFLAGGVRSFDPLQPGRNTIHLFVWFCVASAFIVDRLVSPNLAIRSAKSTFFWIVSAVFAVISIGWFVRFGGPFVDRAKKNSLTLLRQGARAGLPDALPTGFKSLTAELKRRFPSGRRIVFEDRNKGSGNTRDPFGDYRPTPLLPAMTTLEFIGGPYLRTHYKTNRAQAGDGRFFGDVWERRRVERELIRYEVDGVVCWSPEATSFCAANPDLLSPLGESSGFRLFVVNRPRTERESSGVTIRASLNRIEIETPADVRRPMTIPYHWQPGLFADQEVGLRPESSDKLNDGDQPFITIDRPTRRFTISFRPVF